LFDIKYLLKKELAYVDHDKPIILLSEPGAQIPFRVPPFFSCNGPPLTVYLAIRYVNKNAAGWKDDNSVT
jgi:hypothetical protein